MCSVREEDVEDAKRPANCVKRSGKILPNRKHLNQVSRDGKLLCRKQTGSLFSRERVKHGSGDLDFFCPLLPPSYAFGSVGKEKFQIPPNAELKYEVHLKSFEKVSLLEVFSVPESGRSRWP